MAPLTPVTCPNCHDDLRVEPKQPGGWVYCDRCARFFIARSSDDPPPPPWVEPVEIRCPNCVHQCVLGPEYLGRMVRCPHCDRRFRVVSPGDLISLDAVDPGPAPSRATTAEVSAPPRREETAAGEADRPGSAPAPPAAETAAAEARLREAEDQVVILRDQVRDLRTRLERADGAMKADEAEIQRLQQEIQAGAATSNQLAQDLERLRAEREERAAAFGTELAAVRAEFEAVCAERDRLREEARLARAQAEASAAEVDRLGRLAEEDGTLRAKPDRVPIGRASGPTPADLFRIDLAPEERTRDGSAGVRDVTTPPAEPIPVLEGLDGSVAPVHMSPRPTTRVPSRVGVQPVVAVRNVNYWFGQGEARKQVLYDNNLDLYPGELVIMTGPSGSGKTTLLTLIGALRSVQEGSIRLMGQELTGLGQRQLIAVR
ncbi:MAG TPA: ATP-binding cassette domain-containing protein, partial [Opitutaceae bacterium]|nr:ATP-binding cassette domain-containing protein [Opitutaceae bacterium]